MDHKNELGERKRVNSKVLSGSIFIKAINIQGLSKVKVKEIEDLIDENSILCLTETHKKIRDVNFDKNMTILEQMREAKDRKGGGIMILYQQDKYIRLEKVTTKNRDLLFVKGSVRGLDILLIAVYFSVSDKQRNLSMKAEIEQIIESNSDEAILIIGDFNGHVGFKGGQKLNDNGRIILEWMEKFKLTMLNDDMKCEGEITWSRNEQKSVIDFALVTDKLYDKFRKMRIDEDQDIIDISDHNLIEIEIEAKHKRACKSKEWITREFYKTDKDSLERFQQTLEESFIREPVEDISDMEGRIITYADEVLKARYRRRNIGSERKQEEPVWFTDVINHNIQERRRYNRLRRKARREEQKEEEEKWRKMYAEQKSKVQKSIRIAMTMDEEKKAREIKDDKSNGKNIWKYIRKLKGENEKEAVNVLENVYGEDRRKLGHDEATTEIESFWRGIYGKYHNNMKYEWNEQTRQVYVQEREVIRDNIKTGKHLRVQRREDDQDLLHARTSARELREHLDMGFEVREEIGFLQENIVDKEKLIKCLKKIKSKKAPGPDGIKPEFIKIFLESEILLESMLRVLKQAIQTAEVPDRWKESSTVLVPKKHKPKVNEYRPIALTNIGYKLMMSILRENIEEHISMNNLAQENQAGFTTGGRVENNVLIMRHCVEKSYEMQKSLIAISIDFSKAFDSIKRDVMVRVMKEYKLDDRTIEVISKLYQGDVTKIKLGENREISIPVTSGIRQGCTGSTTLFKIVTFKIIQKLQALDKGFKDENFSITSLFYADDGLLLASSIEDAERVVEETVIIAGECGLEINKEKSKALIFNMQDKPQEIAGIRASKTVKYLGITLNDSRNMFKEHKRLMVEKAMKMANITYSVVARSCARMLIGKTYWKSIALPVVLYGSKIMDFTKQEIGKLQRIENNVARKILGAPSYAQQAALRGELGMSSMKGRLMEGQLRYLQYILNDQGNGLLSRIVEEMRNSSTKNKWISGLLEYRQLIGLRGEAGSYLDISRKVKEWDTRTWKEEMDQKVSLKLYREMRQGIGGQDKIYDNREATTILFRCRTNNLDLGDRNRFSNASTECIMCGDPIEDLEHFLLDCPAYSSERQCHPILQQPYQEDRDALLGVLLFDHCVIEDTKDTLFKLWSKRKKKMRNL